jgi:hypothetical protein
MQTLTVIQVVTDVAAFTAAATRVLGATKPFWAKAPAWLASALPAVLVALPALGEGVMGAKTWTDLSVSFLVAGALLLPGLHSHSVGATVPPTPPAQG